MSATENKQLMQDIFAAVAAGDRARFVDRLADDVTMRVTGQYSWSLTFKGKASLLRDMYGYLSTLLADGRSADAILCARWQRVGSHLMAFAHEGAHGDAGRPARS